MKSVRLAARCRCGSAITLFLFALLLAGSASATSETVVRASTNVAFGPLDMALGPVVATRSVYRNLQDIDDTMAVRVAYAVPGVVWNSMVIMAGGLIRTISGIIEFLPGVVLIPFETDMDPIFAPAERSDALIDEAYSWGIVKIGINYVE